MAKPFRIAQISDLVVFDYLTNNIDRWSGSNAKASPDMKLLFFMDNTLSFGRERKGHTKVQSYLSRVQKFSRSLVEKVRVLDRKTVRAAISGQTDRSELDMHVAADGLGNVYALGTFNEAVLKFTPEGRFVTKFGSSGDQPGQFRRSSTPKAATSTCSTPAASPSA